MSNTVGWKRLVIKGRNRCLGSSVDCNNLASIAISANLPSVELIEISNCSKLTRVVVESHANNASLVLRSECVGVI